MADIKVKKNQALRIGFIGGGVDSAVGGVHRIAASMDGRWRLVSGCFSTIDKINLQTGLSWGVEKNRIYPDWKRFLKAEKGRLDAVAVLTPTPAHERFVISALEQGYPVICEKALGISSEEVARISATVKKTRGFLAVTYIYTGYPMLRELRAVIRKGSIGKINQVHIEMPQDGYVRLGKNNSKPKPQSWRLRDLRVPTLSLDLGVHLHQMVDFLTAEKPLEVVSTNDNFGIFKGIVDNTLCIARYSGGLVCHMWFGKTAFGHSNGLRIRVYGTKGSAEWFQLDPETLRLNDNVGRKISLERSAASIEVANQSRYTRFKAGHPAGFIEAFGNHYSDLADSLIEFKKKGKSSSRWVFGVDVAEKGLLMLEAMFASARKRSWQRVKAPRK